MDPVTSWMKRAVETGSWRRFDDLHVDDSSSPREDWVNAAFCLFQQAIVQRDSHYPEYSVMLGFSLSSSRLAWNSREELLKSMSAFSPPSVYVFGRKSVELRDALSDASTFAVPEFFPLDVLAYYRPKDHTDDQSAASVLGVSSRS